ncbi:hypothetical protein AVEN_13742-1 [Araneus ventricosus]|uniref:Uncharacterized protein n=1 Tax=Araneus ventricosus TaxID=182803 RepID=A0A4Y2LK40_ARAVE|nr:hypothetical protein AVEN_13742-1 [Araneus ventricosus]
MESMRLSISDWDIISHSCTREFSNCGIVSRGYKRLATHLPRMSQTCSIGFMSGECASQSIRSIPLSKKKLFTSSTMWPGVIVHENEFIPDFCSVRDQNRSEDLIPISLSRQCSIPDNVQVDAVIDRHTGPDHNSTSAKSDTFVHKLFRALNYFGHTIIPSATFSPDDNRPTFRLNTKVGLIREEHVAPLSSYPSEMLLCHPSASGTVALC